MNEEPRRRGRPPKSHLQDEHHFRTSDDTASVDSGQADSSDEALTSDSASAELIDDLTKDAALHFGEGIPELRVNDSSITSVNSGEAVVESPILEPVSVILTESPIIQKIHDLVEERINLNGWHPIETDVVLNSPPRNGNPVRLSEIPEGEGVIAFWKRVRAFANATKRWKETGVWYDFYTGQKISFEPKYWKERF